MPAPRHRRKEAQDSPIALTGCGAPALQQHFMHRGQGEKITFERERPVGQAAESRGGLIAVGVKAVSQGERAGVNIQMTPGGFSIAGAGAERRHPSKTVTTPRAGAELPALCERGADDLPVARGAVSRDEIERIQTHQMGKMPMAAGQRRAFIEQQCSRRRRVPAAQLPGDGGPLGGVLRRAAGRRHFCQRQEKHLQRHEIVVAVRNQEGAPGVVKNLRRTGERQFQHAMGIRTKQMAQAFTDFPAPRIGAGAEEMFIRRVTPVQIKQVRVPRAHGGGKTVLAPAAEGLSLAAHDAGNRRAGRLVKLPGELAEYRQQIPKHIEKRSALLKLTRRLISHVTHLGVEVVVVIAFPRRQAPRVRRPYSLQRHGRRAPPRGGPVKVTHQVVMLEQVRFGNEDLRTVPECGPPTAVLLE